MKIKIMGWEKINARKDVSNPSWFKFKHKFFEDSEFYDFSFEEKICWIYILCEASKKNDNGNLVFSSPHALHVAKLSPTAVNSTIKKLKQLQIIEVRTVRGRYVDGTFACSREDKIREEEIRLEEIREEKSTERPQAVRYRATNEYLILDDIFKTRKVSEEVQKSWTVAFPEPQWVITEIRKALSWEASNPRKRKKNFSAFITNWLNKGWDNRKILSNPINKAEARFQQNKYALETCLSALENVNE